MGSTVYNPYQLQGLSSFVHPDEPSVTMVRYIAALDVHVGSIVFVLHTAAPWHA